MALAEKARRTRSKIRQRVRLAPEDFIDTERPPDVTHGVTSLVLNKDHPFADLYYKKARYKVYWGGRGSAKSWAIAEALIRLTASLPLRVLCLREFQNSIKESSHKILVDTIHRLGLTSWFEVTETSIRSRCGAEFMFKGCFNKLNSLRSTEGVDICWLEEAHTISEASWRVIIPTIRKDGSEIWVSFNMDDEMDATYRRLVANRRPDAIVHKVNYDQNPYFPEVLRAEMEYDKATDYNLYLHVWEGHPRKVSNAIVLSGRVKMREDSEFDWQHGWREFGQEERLRYGMDFGFAQDPCALLRMWRRRHKAEINGAERDVVSLMISHEAYGTGVDLDDLPEFMDSVPGCRDWPIGADCSRPETISHLKNRGFRIYGAEKWDGSVKDGITHLRGYYEISVHPGCANTLKEAHLYRYKVDPKIVDEHGQPLVLPIIVDRHNHAWDACRYGLDGEIQRGGAMGTWHTLADQAPADYGQVVH